MMTAEGSAPELVAEAAPALTPQASEPDRTTEPAKVTAAPPKPAVRKGWWPARRSNALNILAVASAQYSKAITVSTDGRFDDAASAANSIAVVASDGSAVPPKWSVAADKKMLILAVAPGRYAVTIDEGLKDASGKSVGKTSTGPIEIR